MAHIQFSNTPGQLHDLFFLFILHFNQEDFRTDTPLMYTTSEERAYYAQLLEKLPPIPEELRIFFHAGESGKCFMSHMYFDKKIDAILRDEYDLSAVRNELFDTQRVIDNVLMHYFPSLSDSERDACKNSLSTLSQTIKSCDHPSEIKAALYDFFINPEITLRKLSDELLSKSFTQELDYNRNYNLHNRLRETFDFDTVAQLLKEIKICSVDTTNCEIVHVSFCLYAQSMVYSNLRGNSLFLMLGSEYNKVLSSLKVDTLQVDLKAFCQSLSDTNRYSILELVDRHGEIIAKDVEAELGLSAPNTYYHLSCMLKSGVLKVRSQGKLVYYSVNSSLFQDLAKKLLIYAKRRESKE